MALSNPPFVSGGPAGSYLQQQHTVRPMTIYAMAEAELENLQMFANDVTLYSAIATGAASWGAGVVWERFTTNDQFDDIRLGMIIGAVIVTAVTGFIAWRSEGKRTSALGKLKASAQVVEIETAAKQVHRGKTK